MKIFILFLVLSSFGLYHQQLFDILEKESNHVNSDHSMHDQFEDNQQVTNNLGNSYSFAQTKAKEFTSQSADNSKNKDILNQIQLLQDIGSSINQKLSKHSNMSSGGSFTNFLEKYNKSRNEYQKKIDTARSLIKNDLKLCQDKLRVTKYSLDEEVNLLEKKLNEIGSKAKEVVII